MFYLKTLRARHMSRRGDHTAALMACDMKDIPVLSKAGMHLAVLERSVKPSIERAIALARVGEIDSAFDLAAPFASSKGARSLLGLLAALSPERTLGLIRSVSGLEAVHAYCLSAIGESDQAARVGGNITVWHRIVECLRVGNLAGAQERIDGIFREAGLSIPKFSWFANGIDFASLHNALGGAKKSRGPLISVVMTAHNEEACIAVAIESILAQSWQEIELIIVDDASNDATGKIATRFAERDRRIKVISLKENRGLWEAKNVGLQQCRGEIITMHDADDWSHCDKLALQIQPLLDQASLQATSSYMVRIDQASGQPYTRNARNYLRWNPSSFMFRRRVLEESGGFIDKMLGSDCEFVCRLETRFGVSAHIHLRLPLSIGLQRGGSLSNRFRDGHQAMVRIQHWEEWRRKHVKGALMGPRLF